MRLRLRAARLSAHIQRLGWTQIELAKRSGITPEHLSRLMTGGAVGLRAAGAILRGAGLSTAEFGWLFEPVEENSEQAGEIAASEAAA